MQKTVIFTLLNVILLTSVLFGQKEKELEEKESIKKAIMDYYHEGHVKSDPKYYENILHDDWSIFYLNDKGELKKADKKTYMSWYDPSKIDTTLKWETKFLYVDVSEHLASVKLCIENQKFGYIDYFNLMKIDGKWWIVHKISRRK